VQQRGGGAGRRKAARAGTRRGVCRSTNNGSPAAFKPRQDSSTRFESRQSRWSGVAARRSTATRPPQYAGVSNAAETIESRIIGRFGLRNVAVMSNHRWLFVARVQRNAMLAGSGVGVGVGTPHCTSPEGLRKREVEQPVWTAKATVLDGRRLISAREV